MGRARAVSRSSRCLALGPPHRGGLWALASFPSPALYPVAEPEMARGDGCQPALLSSVGCSGPQTPRATAGSPRADTRAVLPYEQPCTTPSVSGPHGGHVRGANRSDAEAGTEALSSRAGHRGDPAAGHGQSRQRSPGGPSAGGRGLGREEQSDSVLAGRQERRRHACVDQCAGRARLRVGVKATGDWEATTGVGGRRGQAFLPGWPFIY